MPEIAPLNNVEKDSPDVAPLNTWNRVKDAEEEVSIVNREKYATEVESMPNERNKNSLFRLKDCVIISRLAGWDGWMNRAYSRLSTTHGHITDCKLLVCMYWTRLVLVRPAASLYP